eukprot:m.55895 g.55895  ORF g.55895 m.55895 type:complete len:126 (+) comp16922_c0_seq1:86-463(+)
MVYAQGLIKSKVSIKTADVHQQRVDAALPVNNSSWHTNARKDRARGVESSTWHEFAQPLPLAYIGHVLMVDDECSPTTVPNHFERAKLWTACHTSSSLTSTMSRSSTSSATASRASFCPDAMAAT